MPPSAARIEAMSAARRAPGIRRDVAVVAGMQAGRRPVHGQAETHHAAHAERHARQAPRVDRAVAEDPEVRAEQAAVRRERARKVRRARLLLALEEELEVRGERDLRRIERVEGREHGDDRALVVARRARIDARLVGQRELRLGPGNHRRAVLGAARAQHGLEGRRLPRAFRGDRLAVEMRIEKERALRARHAPLAVDGHGRAGRLEDARGNAAFFQHAHQQVRVRADVGRARRDVRQRDQLAQLADDCFLVGGDVPFGRRHRLRLVRGGAAGNDGENQQREKSAARESSVNSSSGSTSLLR